MAFDPKQVINELPLKEDMIAADFGCGSGGWTIPLAKRLKEGVVFAIDILQGPLSVLEGKLSREEIANVKVMKENIEQGVSLKDKRVDLVLMTNLLFQLDKKEKALEEAKRVLAKKGTLIITEWSSDSPLSPKIKKMSEKEVKKLAEEFNFKLKEEFQAGMYQFGFIYQKND
jgi:ubiquinone/menaquinone biosynthesis C-methylase UbiE